MESEQAVAEKADEGGSLTSPLSLQSSQEEKCVREDCHRVQESEVSEGEKRGSRIRRSGRGGKRCEVSSAEPSIPGGENQCEKWQVEHSEKAPVGVVCVRRACVPRREKLHSVGEENP